MRLLDRSCGVVDLREQFGDDVAVIDRWALVTAIVKEGESLCIQTEAMKDGGVDVENVGAIFDGAQADFVGAADHVAGLDAPAREPHGEAPGIMVAALALLVKRRAAKF